MKSSGIVRGMIMCLAALGVCLSGAAFAAPPTPEPAVHDVALADGGVFAGQIVSAQSVAKVGEKVTLLYESRPVATVATDRAGQFQFHGLRGGVYQVAVAGRVDGYRLWAAGTAPKGVPNSVLLVADETLVRGQYYQYQYQRSMVPHLPPMRCLLANPWVVAGVAATAIAVPVGIANADDGNVPTSP